MILNDLQFIQVPIMIDCFDLFFNTIKTTPREGLRILDFSEPALHEYLNHNVAFHFPSIPEDDVIAAYTRCYTPRPGDIVWDVGAHAGASTYFFARLVGPTGHVYAFEPDESNYEYLQKNIEIHQLCNVTLVKKALSSQSGTAQFNMDGSMSAGMSDFLAYSGTGTLTEVETVTIADACSQFGSIPALIKMDIEGAEVSAVEGSSEFISAHALHFAIESFHRIGQTYTYTLLNRLFPEIGYRVLSEDYCGQMFTWANKPDRDNAS